VTFFSPLEPVFSSTSRNAFRIFSWRYCRSPLHSSERSRTGRGGPFFFLACCTESGFWPFFSTFTTGNGPIFCSPEMKLPRSRTALSFFFFLRVSLPLSKTRDRFFGSFFSPEAQRKFFLSLRACMLLFALLIDPPSSLPFFSSATLNGPKEAVALFLFFYLFFFTRLAGGAGLASLFFSPPRNEFMPIEQSLFSFSCDRLRRAGGEDGGGFFFFLLPLPFLQHVGS